jgi:uncharacterized protein
MTVASRVYPSAEAWTTVTTQHSMRIPLVRTLTDSVCQDVLARNHIGRVAFAYHDRVNIAPLHYVVADGWIYGRTSPGGKLEVVAHNHWVAFEVDEIAGLFDWRSVVVHGAWYLRETASGPDAPAWDAGIAQLRALIPGSFTSDDPMPFRSVVFRIHVAEVTGVESLLLP